jgi:hypothetical protein
MYLSSSLRVGGVVFGFLVMTASARADFITGYGWITTDAIAGSSTAASPGSLSLATCSHGTATCTTANADVTFTTTGVNFTPPGLGSGTILSWLTSSAFPLNNLIDTAPSSPLSPTIWEFVGNISVTGTVTTPQTFTFQHDDGVTFIVNGQTVINQPGPTGPVIQSGTYTAGVNSNAPFTLIYSECCGGAAVLAVSLLGPGSAPPASGVPEPATVGLTAIGLATALSGRKVKLGLKRV